jgi:hypothetical protein
MLVPLFYTVRLLQCAPKIATAFSIEERIADHPEQKDDFVPTPQY